MIQQTKRLIDADIDQIAEHDRDDLTEAQRHDGEIVTAQWQGGCAKDEAEYRSDGGGDPDHKPEVEEDVVLR